MYKIPAALSRNRQNSRCVFLSDLASLKHPHGESCARREVEANLSIFSRHLFSNHKTTTQMDRNSRIGEKACRKVGGGGIQTRPVSGRWLGREVEETDL